MIEFNPDWVVAPGETLRDWFAESDLPHSLASEYGINPDVLSMILAGTILIDERLAKKLSNMTQVGATFWLSLEHNYRVGLAAGKTR